MKTRCGWLALLVLWGSISAVASETTPESLFVVHFATGPSWDKSQPPADQPFFAEHSANLRRLRVENTIVFGARYAEFGMVVLRVESLDAAKALLDVDPGVSSGLFGYEIEALNVFYPWREG